jgi:superfamily II DNA or RNA helicase
MHVWIFFDGRVEAKQARRLCTSILTLAMEKRPGISFSSYDRLIPSQDRLPDGGFGNLIALPLQGRAGKQGNSLFVDSDLRQYDDQWEHLSLVKKISPNEIDALLSEMSVGDSYGTLLQDEQSETGGEPWEKKKPQAKLTEDDFAGDVEITRANMLHIGKAVLSPRAINAIKRLAAFKNPDFFKAQAMRLPTYDKPRIISTSEETEEYVSVPRGAEAGLLKLLKDAGAKFELRDLRENGKPLKLKFKGKLREEQNLAAEAMLKRDIGVLSATTAFGKTVVAAFLIASRKVNALVLVHNRELLAQWRESLDEFLDIKTEPPEKFTPTGKKKKVDKIGEYCGVKKNLSGLVDVAMLQSLGKDGETDDFVKDYGMVIVDECHHVPAVSFEAVLKDVNAKYIYGLTATPTRDDGKHAILFLQCGPIQHVVDAKSQAAKRPFEHYMIPRFTGLLPTSVHQDSGMPFLLNDVAADEKRNKMIVRDVASAIDAGRSPLVLTERAGHVKTLSELLSANFENIITMVGGMGAKEKRFARERLATFEKKGKFALVATGKYIGEGFDFPRLDTLFLALPIAWKGKVAQYTGRLHRNYEGKEDVIVYDYVDANIPVLEKMYYKRIKGYKALGYKTMMKEQGPPSQNFIYGAAEYLAAFKADCAAAKSEIVISSPNLSKGKALRLIPILTSKLIDNIVITIFTKPSSPSSKNKIETGNLTAKPAGELQEAGIRVIEKEGLHQRFAIIDKTIVWYGSINPLGYAAADDNMLRLEDEGVGEELARGLVGG